MAPASSHPRSERAARPIAGSPGTGSPRVMPAAALERRARAKPVDLEALSQVFNWGPESRERQVLVAADGNHDGLTSAAEVEAYLADPRDVKVLDNTAIAGMRRALKGAMGTGADAAVDAFEPGWMQAAAGRVDALGDANGRVSPAEFEAFVAQVKAPVVEGRSAELPIWFPQQRAVMLSSRIATRSGEEDLLRVAEHGGSDGSLLLLKNYSQIRFDQHLRIPTHVSYALSADDIDEKPEWVKRQGHFTKEPAAEDGPRPADYTHSGYDRGHNKPARASVDQESMKESFFLSNVKPQPPNTNREVVRTLEAALYRTVQQSGGSAVIVNGSVFADAEGKKLAPADMKWIGPDGTKRVAVPTHNLTVALLTAPSGERKAYAWLVGNEPHMPWQEADVIALLEHSQVSVDVAEQWADADYFADLPVQEATDLEAKVVPFDVTSEDYNSRSWVPYHGPGGSESLYS